jgi:hypothetical protein
MKSLAKSVEQQIQQLEHFELKQFLLRHINLEATCLAELFCKQYTADAKTIRLPQAISANPIFCMVYTFGPQALIAELHTLFSSLPSMAFDSFRQELSGQCTVLLQDFRKAWPFIKQLQQQPHNVIALMTEAKSTELEAFRRLNPESDWALLTEAFLIDHHEINRWTLINFLRQPQWIEHTQNLLSSLQEKASALLSMEFLLYAFGSQDDAIFRLKKPALYKEYPLPIHRAVLTQCVSNGIEQLSQKKEGSSHKNFIILFDELLRTISSEEQRLVLQELDLAQLMDFIEQCIEALVLDVDYRDANKRVLFLLSTQLRVLNPNELELVRNRLNQIDNHSVLDDKTENSFYPLEQAFLSPSFMALATSEVIDKLIIRFHCFVLTLSHEEFLNFITPAKELNPDYQTLVARLTHLEAQLIGFKSNKEKPERSHLIEQHDKDRERMVLSSPIAVAKQNELREEQQRLIYGCIEDFIHGLFEKLIKRCQLQKKEIFAAQALTQVYLYYINHYSTLRGDLLFGALNHFYGLTEKQLNWLEVRNHSSFYKDEESMAIYYDDIYSSNSSSSLLVDESRRLAPIEDVSPLTEMGYIFTPSQELSARVLSELSTEELEASNEGFALLMKHLLLQNNIALLYKALELKSEQGPLKRTWLEEKIAHALQEASYPIDVSTWVAVSHYFRPETVFVLWASMHYTPNALMCFHSVVNNITLSELFFLGHYDDYFYDFLNHHGAVGCFANYLLCHHQQPWFLQGLTCFGRYLQATNNRCLLADTLNLLSTKVTQGELSAESFNNIVLSLILSEQAGAILLLHFWGDQEAVAVQEIRTVAIDETVTHFSKKQLVYLIEQLNALPAWQQSPFYRIVLFILQSQHQRLLWPLAKEQSPWQRQELKEFAVFINRHLDAKNPSDDQLLIGFKVLGPLLLHSAAIGQTDLFFKNRERLSRIITYTVPSRLLAQLIDNLMLPSFYKDSRGLPVGYVGNDWIQHREALAQELSDNPLFQDYHTLIIQTHNQTTKKIPILSMYLLHYAGSVGDVAKLLEQYFNTYAEYKALIYPVSDLLITFPERSISAVIFSSLQQVVLSNPQFLDKVLLEQMAHYFLSKNGLVGMDATIQLVTIWGQAKYYPLVKQACAILLGDCSDNALKIKLMKALIEVRIEQELQLLVQVNSWYSSSIIWFKRLWNYGFRWEHTTSQLLNLFDEETKDANLSQCSVAEIEIPMPLVKENDSEQYQQLINLLAEVLRSSINRDQNGLTPGEQKHLFYNKTALESVGPLQEVASQAVLVNV